MELLKNIFWNTLQGEHARYSVGTDTARRYAQGFSPILGFAEAQSPDFAAIAPYCAIGERIYCNDWSGPAPAGWSIQLEALMTCMVWDAPLPEDRAQDAQALGAEHVEQALALTALTRPGPFGPRTIDMGDYFGYLQEGRLIAMSGERMCAPGLREISGVCTAPGHQGQGLARKLMEKLLRRQVQRNEQPFLHVMSANAGARALYTRMGFRDYRETLVRIVAREQ